MEARITAADPRRLLERGYVLALDGGGVVIKSAAGRKTGDNVVLMFPDGSLECTVDNVRL
jgi:exonuclease VII large subunit